MHDYQKQQGLLKDREIRDLKQTIKDLDPAKFEAEITRLLADIRKLQSEGAAGGLKERYETGRLVCSAKDYALTIMVS